MRFDSYGFWFLLLLSLQHFIVLLEKVYSLNFRHRLCNNSVHYLLKSRSLSFVIHFRKVSIVYNGVNQF